MNVRGRKLGLMRSELGGLRSQRVTISGADKPQGQYKRGGVFFLSLSPFA